MTVEQNGIIAFIRVRLKFWRACNRAEFVLDDGCRRCREARVDKNGFQRKTESPNLSLTAAVLLSSESLVMYSTAGDRRQSNSMRGFKMVLFLSVMP